MYNKQSEQLPVWIFCSSYHRSGCSRNCYWYRARLLYSPSSRQSVPLRQLWLWCRYSMETQQLRSLMLWQPNISPSECWRLQVVQSEIRRGSSLKHQLSSIRTKCYRKCNFRCLNIRYQKLFALNDHGEPPYNLSVLQQMRHYFKSEFQWESMFRDIQIVLELRNVSRFKSIWILHSLKMVQLHNLTWSSILNNRLKYQMSFMIFFLERSIAS